LRQAVDIDAGISHGTDQFFAMGSGDYSVPGEG
jgi:hypothetical protein